MQPPFRVERVAATECPQQLVYIALHNDYSEDFVCSTELPEDRCGEIAVERLLKGNRGHYGCYSADTSVMTDRGWVRWPEVTHQDKLLAVDVETGDAMFEQPTALFAQDVLPGDRLYHARSQRVDLLVTHDHRMVVSRRKKSADWSSFSFRPAHDVAGRPVRYRVTTELGEEQRHIPADLPPGVSAIDALRVAGFYFGDGVRGRNVAPLSLRFRLRRARKIQYLEDVSTSIGVLERRQDDRYTLQCGPLATWVTRHFQSESGKAAPSWLIHLPRPELLAFLDGLRHSDGTKFKSGTSRGGESWALDSCEYEALRIIQAAAAMNHIATCLYMNHPNEGEGHENHRPCWRLSFSHDRQYARFEVHQSRTHGHEYAVPYEGKVYCATVSTGALLVERNGKPIVSGNCLEHPQLTLALKADHNTIMQLRTHRVGVSFDVQSMRYSGKRIEKVAAGELPIEEVFYVRPPGKYRDRQGDPYEWTEDDAEESSAMAFSSAIDYWRLRERGVSEEHARGVLITNYFQNAIVSGNLRSWLHLLDVRLKSDAQFEIRCLMELVCGQVQRWVPEIYAWYAENRRSKALLAP